MKPKTGRVRNFWAGWGGLIAVALIAFAFGQWLRSGGAPFRDVGAHPELPAILADDAAPATGPADADVTLIVFTDYRCPVCRLDEPALARAVKRDGHVRVSYRDWPIFGGPSILAARTAIAAAAQGRYGPVHQALMQAPVVDEAGIRDAAIAAGADWDRIMARRDTPAVTRRIAENNRQALALALPGTPAYLAGRWLAVGRLGEAGFTRLIERARGSR